MSLNLSLSYLLRYPEILFSLASFLLIYIVRCFYRSSGSVIPINWPLVGMLPGLAINSHDFNNYVAAVLKEAGGNFLFKGPWFTGMDTIVTCDPANINHVLNANFPNYIKGPEFAEYLDTLGDGFLTTDGDLWAFQRRIGLALVTSPKFWSDMRAKSLKKAAEGLVPLLNQIARENCVVDLCDLLGRYSFDLALVMVLGIDPGCLSPDLPEIPFSKAMLEIEHVSFCRITTPRFLWKLKRRFLLREEKKVPMAQKIVDDFLAQCIEKKREENNAAGRGQDVNVLSLLMESGRQDRSVSDKFIRDSLLSFIFASKDNAVVVVSWLLWLLSMNPRVEKKILEELQRLKPPSNSSTVFTAEEVDELVYLHASIHESLRLCPPVPYNIKLALEDGVLPSGHRVNAGQHVFISSYAVARMEGVWGEDCLEFRPERWIDEKTGKLRREPSHKFPIFHSGPRSCVGKNLVMMTTKMAAAALMYNFEVAMEEGHVVKQNLSMVLQINGLRVRLKKRIWSTG